jgi:predicted ATP-grasp superfamily ATP-dependent carboligase
MDEIDKLKVEIFDLQIEFARIREEIKKRLNQLNKLMEKEKSNGPVQ